MRRENRAIETIATLEPSGEARERWARLCAHGMDWECLHRRLLEERLDGLFFYHTRRDPETYCVPEDLRSRLQSDYYRRLRDGWIRMEGLKGVLEALAAKQIPVVVFRGPALLEGLYPDPGIRAWGDIDLAVPEATMPAVRSVLCALGFGTDSRHSQLYYRGDLLLDLHTRFLDPGRIPLRRQIGTLEVEAAWQRGHRPEAYPENARTLSPCDRLLTLALHAQKHSFRQWIWVVDILETLRALPATDRPGITRRARETGTLSALLFSIACCQYLQRRPMLPEAEFKTMFHDLSPLERAYCRMLMRGRRINPVGEVLFVSRLRGISAGVGYLKQMCFPEGVNAAEFPGRAIRAAGSLLESLGRRRLERET